MGLVLVGWMHLLAEPARIDVHPRGTNHLQFIASSLATNTSYLIMVRTNSPDGYWIQLSDVWATGNRTSSVDYDLNGARNWKGSSGLTTRNLGNWTFVIVSGEDFDGDTLPDGYEDLVTRSDPYGGEESYNDPDGDGWTNMQEMQNHTDPLKFDQPPPPANPQVNYYTNGTTKITWSIWTGAPEYFLVEKAQRTLHPGTNVGPFILQLPSSPNQTNMAQWWARQREIQERYGRPFSRQHDAFSTIGEYHLAAKVPAIPGQQDYAYIETNLARSFTLTPVYRIRAHYKVPLRAYLEKVDATTLRQTRLAVTARKVTDGYELIALHPIPYARYLLLVRDQGDSQWRASGYFTSGTNANPVQLHV